MYFYADTDSNQPIVIGNNTFTNNSAQSGNGGVMFIYATNANQSIAMGNNTFTNNSAQAGTVGGVMFITALNTSQPIAIGNNTFTNNSAPLSGGVMYIVAGSDTNQPIAIGNNTFTNNSAQSGGILYTKTTNTAMYITLEEAIISGSMNNATDIVMLDSSNEGTIKLMNIHLIEPSPDHFIGNMTTKSVQFEG